MPELDAVLFDVDGTLVDSERHGHRIAFNRAFEDAGLPYRWDEDPYGELLKITGGKERLTYYLTGEGMARAEIERVVPALHERKNEVFLELVEAGRIPARPGAPELVDALEESGVTLAIVTTGSPEWVKPLVDRLYGLERFAVAITAEEAPNKKPDPSAYHTALERLGLDPGRAVAIEDSRQGLRAAKAAGLRCVVVPNDYTRHQDLDAADLLVDGFAALTAEKIKELAAS
ncbi:MAG: HAD-IA family hydrolase [Actinomycetota bacterium]